MFITGNEGAELVYQGKGGTGSAYEVKAPTFTKPEIDKTAARKEISDVNSKLNLLNAGITKAWDNDRIELENDYNAVVEKLKDYEATKNKAEKRDKWYTINAEMGKLQQKIYSSSKQRDAYVTMNQKVEADTKGIYNKEGFDGQPSVYEELENWRKKSVLDRGEVPKVTTNTTQSAINYVLKNVRYKPTIFDDFEKKASGKWERTKTKKIDPVALQDDLALTIRTMPQNLQHILYRTPTAPGSSRTLLDDFYDADPKNRTITDPNEQFLAFTDWVAEKIMPTAANSIQQAESLAKSDYTGRGKSSGAASLNLRFASGFAYSDRAYYNMNKIDDQGTYRIDVQAVNKSGVKENPNLKWTVSGAELKKIGVKASGIIDTDNYVVEGTLKTIDINEEQGLEPVVNIALKSENGKSYVFDPSTKNMVEVQTPARQVPVSYEQNTLQVVGMGGVPGTIYANLKGDADEKYKKKKTAPASGSTGATKAPTGGKKTIPKKPK